MQEGFEGGEALVLEVGAEDFLARRRVRALEEVGGVGEKGGEGVVDLVTQPSDLGTENTENEKASPSCIPGLGARVEEEEEREAETLTSGVEISKP